MLLSPEIIARIKQIEWRARYLVTDFVMGEYLSAFKGRGVEFEEVRPYVPGDEVRLIDWNVSARMQMPFVKVLREEREFTVFLLVDTSASMNFASVDRRKADLAAEVAAIFAFLATKNNDRLGLVSFADKVHTMLPPNKGRAHVWNVIKTLLTANMGRERTDFVDAVRRFDSLAKRRSLCVLISDFRHVESLEPLRQIARKHDLLCIEVRDPREMHPVNAGLLELRDQETGEVLELDLTDQDFLKLWQETEEQRREQLASELRRYGAQHLIIQTNEDTIRPIERFLRFSSSTSRRYRHG